MATGPLRPDAGSVEVAAVDVWHDPPAAKARIGVVQDNPALFDRLTGHELLAFQRRAAADRPRHRAGARRSAAFLFEAAAIGVLAAIVLIGRDALGICSLPGAVAGLALSPRG